MRIAHISDLHIRNFKYRDEYNVAFDHLYKQLKELQPDLVINTGDTVHSKLAVSPELFDDVAGHMQKVAEIAPYWIALGNHDLNLKNKSRTDAISPIIRALNNPDIKLLDDGCHVFNHRFMFWNHDIRKADHIFDVSDAYVNIGMYHGSISGCQTDMGFIMEDGEAEVSKFDKMDFVLLGDIHKRQSFRGGRIQYPGSLIQQNYGEETVKGFLLWEIIDKNTWSTEFHEVRAPGRFYTIQVPASLDLDGIDVPYGSRIRARLEGELSPSKRLELERLITERFKPIEVITPDSSGEREKLAELEIDRLVSDRRQMAEDYLNDKGCTSEQIADVMRLFREFESQVDDVGAGRGTTWSLSNISWDNMMNYGEDNSINFSKLSGLVGIFAPNASGKSTIFDVILESLFDKVSKEVPRNIDLINDNKDSGVMKVGFRAGGNDFEIERSIERITYGQRKLLETKQWGKTSLNFSSNSESLNGTSRPETEKSIRSIIGSFEDFSLTTMVSQNPIFGLPGGGDIINCKETDRRKILFRFLDLDIYDRVSTLCKDELKTILGGIKGKDRAVLEAQVEDIEQDLLLENIRLTDARERLEAAEAVIASSREKLTKMGAEDVGKLVHEESMLDDSVVMANSKLRTATGKLSDAQKQLEKLNAENETEKDSRPIVPSISLEDLESKIDELTRADRDTEQQHALKKVDLVRGKAALKTIQDVPCGGQFPTCKFISDAVEFNTDCSVLERAIDVLHEESAQIGEKICELRELEVVHKNISKWEKKNSQRLLDIEKVSGKVRDLTRDVDDFTKKVETLQAELDAVRLMLSRGSLDLIASIEDEIKAAQKDADDGKYDIEGCLRRIGSFDSMRAGYQKEIAQLQENQRIARSYEILAEMTGKVGLPYRILTKILPVINDEISNILVGVAKFSVFFEDDPESQTVSLYIRYGDYKSRPLGLGSGAEKFIASLAVRVALLSVSSLPKTDILIIDEGFGKLDPEHLEALQRMFEYLKGAFGTVFIVSHVDFMRDIVDHSIEITSQDGYAHVSVV